MADVSSEQLLSELSDCKRNYSASTEELLNNLSQLRASALDDKQFAEKESFLQSIGRNIKEMGIKFMSKFKGV